MPRSRKNEQVFCHILCPTTANPRLGERAGSGPLPQGTFVIWRDEKVKNTALFFRPESFRQGRFRPQNGTFAQILGVPTGKENPEESRKYAKKKVVWSGTRVIFPPKISIFVSFRSEKGCNSTTRKPPLGGYTGWPMNCCPATQKVVILDIILTQNPSNWGSKIDSKIR